MNQHTRILMYLAHHKTGITQLEATKELGITRLAARIMEMERKGWNIERNWVDVQNRYGETCRVMRYWLRPE